MKKARVPSRERGQTLPRETEEIVCSRVVPLAATRPRIGYRTASDELLEQPEDRIAQVDSTIVVHISGVEASQVSRLTEEEPSQESHRIADVPDTIVIDVATLEHDRCASVLVVVVLTQLGKVGLAAIRKRYNKLLALVFSSVARATPFFHSRGKLRAIDIAVRNVVTITTIEAALPQGIRLLTTILAAVGLALVDKRGNNLVATLWTRLRKRLGTLTVRSNTTGKEVRRLTVAMSDGPRLTTLGIASAVNAPGDLIFETLQTTMSNVTSPLAATVIAAAITVRASHGATSQHRVRLLAALAALGVTVDLCTVSTLFGAVTGFAVVILLVHAVGEKATGNVITTI